MSENPLFIRAFQMADKATLVSLWQLCELTVPWNNPYKDIARKLKIQPELFLVGVQNSLLIASVMGGYDGHRGWINYLAVHPDFQGQGYAQQMMKSVESELRKIACPKINLQIRSGNAKVMKFYQKLGFTDDRVLSMGKRLEEDHS
jgi:ribosomal protein S18 acetylase RimI-like enzyme